MLCELCKEAQATVHLTEIVNDQMAEMHLCESCANQKGSQVETHFGLSDLLSGLTDVGKSEEVEESSASPSCGNCGMTYDDFRQDGRLGCSECYVTFKRGLSSLLKRIHGSPVHLGKSPSRSVKKSNTKSELTELKNRLERAIELEEFEEAARLRDQVRRLEQRDQKRKKNDGTSKPS